MGEGRHPRHRRRDARRRTRGHARIVEGVARRAERPGRASSSAAASAGLPRSTPRWSTAPPPTRSTSTTATTRSAAIPRRRSCRRCSRWRTRSARAGAISSPPTSPASRPSARSRSGVHFLPLHQGLAPDRDARRLRRRRGLREAAEAARRQDRHRARHRRLARLGHQGQLRHDGEAAARRPLHPQRTVRGAARARRTSPANPACSSTSRASSTSSTARATTTRARYCPAWAQPLDIVKPGIAIKQYPCCGSTHSALDAMLKLAREHKPAADDIERVDVWTHARRLEHTNRPDPKSDLDAKFSVQYCMTRALHRPAGSRSSISRTKPTSSPRCASSCRKRARRALHHRPVPGGKPLRRGSASHAARRQGVVGQGGPAVRPDLGQSPARVAPEGEIRELRRARRCRASASGRSTPRSRVSRISGTCAS